MNYGMPYKGSKNKIAKKIIDVLPEAECFVDLFGGGGAMSHCAAMSGKYQKVIYNEIDPVIAKAFEMAIDGEFKNENRWIDRETFHRLKNTDPYVAMCFSFGNNLKTYCYSPEIEPWKKAIHYARVLGNFSKLEEFGIISDGSREDIKKNHKEYKEKYIKWYLNNILNSEKSYEELKQNLESNIQKSKVELQSYLIKALKQSGLTRAEVDRKLGTNGMAGHYFSNSQWEFPTREKYNQMCEFMPLQKSYEEIYGLQTLLQSLESLERLQSLERLERLESLERLERLQTCNIEVQNKSYENVEIPENSVIYCDTPYRNTDKYKNEFDYDKFYNWCRSLKQTVYISEYQMPDDFIESAKFQKTCHLSATNNKRQTIEKLFKNR